jgi:hypothetical protein
VRGICGFLGANASIENCGLVSGALQSHTFKLPLPPLPIWLSLEVKLQMVEVEIHKHPPTTSETENTTLDINEIVGKVRSFVDSIRTMQSDGQPLKVSLEGFNVAVGKDHDEYEFALKLNLVFKPQASKPETACRTETA